MTSTDIFDEGTQFTYATGTEIPRSRKEVAAELLQDYEAFLTKAKANGFDVRLNASAPTLKLYFNELYPDVLLVDQAVSNQYFYYP